MRVFVAIPVSEEIKKKAESIKNELLRVGADVKWVEPHNYHLTVKFLGETSEQEVARVVRALQRVGEESPPFALKPGRAGFFPNERRPRVIWIGIQGELDKAFWLGERVDAYLAEMGYDPEENRKYHLTLGRIRSERNTFQLVSLLQKLSFEADFPWFQVKEIHLMQSELSSKGPTYTVLETIPLSG